jgi:hypothetical protein
MIITWTNSHFSDWIFITSFQRAIFCTLKIGKYPPRDLWWSQTNQESDSKSQSR